MPPIDILIDDGGHTMEQQIRTFEALFPVIQPHGIYLCEDVCTSYWKEFGGGYKRRGTFIEYSKRFIDSLHAWHSREPQRLGVSDFSRTAKSVHFYDSVVVVEKGPASAPVHKRVGHVSFPDYKPPKRGVKAWVKRKVLGAPRP